jgi:TonB family protein
VGDCERKNMRHCFAIAVGVILLIGLIVGPTRSAPRKTPQFTSPGIASAGAIQYPVNTMAAGAVSLLMSLDSSAQIQNVQVLRDFPPLTSSVQSAVKNWKLTPATLNGHAVSSEISVTVIFNIFNPAGGAASQSLVLAPPQSIPPDASQFIPPQINMASFANYPADSVSQGSVVLDVTVSKAGNPTKIRVVRGIPTLSEQAVIAVKNWGFNAATIQGQSTAAQMIIAFVFQRNIG